MFTYENKFIISSLLCLFFISTTEVSAGNWKDILDGIETVNDEGIKVLRQICKAKLKDNPENPWWQKRAKRLEDLDHLKFTSPASLRDFLRDKENKSQTRDSHIVRKKGDFVNRISEVAENGGADVSLLRRVFEYKDGARDIEVKGAHKPKAPRDHNLTKKK